MNITVTRKPGTEPSQGDRTTAAGVPPASEHSIAGLLKQIAQEVPLLFTKELGLAKAEAREAVHTATAGVAAVATGGAVMLAGLIILLLAAAAGLSLVLPAWLAGLIIGLAALIVGALMVVAGKKQFGTDALKPQRTVDAMKKDQAVIEEKTA